MHHENKCWKGHIDPPTLVSPMDGWHTRMVRSQQHLDVTYKVVLPFTKYVCCTFEWALPGNLCKHQVVIFLICIDFTKENIIQYHGTWYGSNHGSFAAMFGTLHIYTFMIMSPIMRNPMKMTLKNHGLPTWVGFWHWMVFPPMLREKRIKTNLQFQMPPWK